MMSTLWPKEMPRHTDSEAEKKVFEALKAGLPKGWHAGQSGETDFVIADPGKPALLLLETKGGQIEMRDGRWHQNGHAMDFSPLNQAFAFRSLLIEHFKELNMNRPKIGCAVYFPDAVFEKGPPGDDLDVL